MADMTTDPRRPGGDISGPGGPLDRHGVVLDTRDAVLLEHVNVALVEPYSDGEAKEPVLALKLEGRINKTDERADILYLFGEDGAAAITTEIMGLATRIGPAFASRFKDRLKEVIEASKPGRNDPCHCGSGKKFKRCCGA